MERKAYSDGLLKKDLADLEPKLLLFGPQN